MNPRSLNNTSRLLRLALICLSFEGHVAGVSRGGPPLSHLPAPGVPVVLCHLRAHGPVCAGERGGGRVDETPGGEQQGDLAEEHLFLFVYLFIFGRE